MFNSIRYNLLCQQVIERKIMETFTTGQHVECIDAKSAPSLIKSFTYRVREANETHGVKLIDELGNLRWFLAYRFKPVTR